MRGLRVSSQMAIDYGTRRCLSDRHPAAMAVVSHNTRPLEIRTWPRHTNSSAGPV